MPTLKVIVGLGNPGDKYKTTRHNFGRHVVIATARKLQAPSFKLEIKFKALISHLKTSTVNVLFVLPETYMNNSGISVKSIVDYYNLALADLLIVNDDIDLPVGKLRLRTKGGHGGHNGLKDIINLLHTDEINRLRLGVGKSDFVPTDKWVLSNFNPANLDTVNQVTALSVGIIERFIANEQIPNLMSIYNQTDLKATKSNHE